MPDLRRSIEKLLARLSQVEDGEFGELADRRPYAVVAPRVAAGRLVFTPKWDLAPELIVNELACESLGTVCRYGLPDEADLAWLRPLAAQHEVYFLGDLDPLDLLAFAWLRDALAPQPVLHLGLNDAYLEALAVEVPQTYQIPLQPSESEALSRLPRLLPDLDAIVGPRAMQILRDGRKLELEAVAACGCRKQMLDPLLGPE